MLVKLMGEQIGRNWDTIKYAIESSLPPVVGESKDKMNNILTSLLSGEIDCWVSTDKEGKIEAILTTIILLDSASSTSNLLIYSLYSFGLIGEDSWESGFKTLETFAKGKGCSRIIAYTDVESIIERARKIGGEAKYTLISLPL